MGKLEALKYICKNFNGSEFEYCCLSETILENREEYTKEELDSMINKIYNY